MRHLLFIVLPVLLVACGTKSPGTDNPDVSDDTSVTPTDTTETDISATDSTENTDSETSSEPDTTSTDNTGTDASTGTDSETGTDTTVIVEPKASGESCLFDSECEIGLCVPTPDGNVCATECTGSCPTDWVCRSAPEDSGLSIQVCLHTMGTHCFPCTDHAQCAERSGDPLAKCITQHVDLGYFCALDCSNSKPCPAGFACLPGEGPGKITFYQKCQPANFHCPCNESAKELNLSTPCGLGACSGQRTCEADGLTDCSGGEPDPDVCDASDGMCINGEICDLIDNDCDGLVDELGTLTCGYGECRHTVTICVDGVENKPDPYEGAEPEICDGLDNDCDNKTDENGNTAFGEEPWPEGAIDHYYDSDQDGYGNPLVIKKACQGFAPPYLVENNLDCNDDEPTVSPDKPELCGNGVDDNCDGNIDEGSCQ
ncbi:MAG: hypothetical protein CMH54_14855 [Myxococcales bacterium]|nr:hypothetical protein [Myxococcales bacterium]